MKIGFVALSHADYLDQLSRSITEQAVMGLRLSGNDVLSSGRFIVTQREAIDESIHLMGSDLDGVVLFLATWVECNVVMTVVQELGHLPLLLWGFPMVEREGIRQSTGSYVSFAMFKGVLDRLGKKYSRLLGLPDDSACMKKARRFCRVASAMKQMHRARLGMVGYSAMSIYTGTFDHVLLRALLGPEVVHIDSYSIIRTAQAMDAAQISDQEQWLREISPVAADVEKADLETAASVLLSLQKYCLDLDLDGINVKCQCEFSKEFGAVACVPVSALAEQGLVGACEGDMLCTVSMLLLNKLASQPVSYGDCINHAGQVLTLSACGFMPFSFADREQRLIRKFMPHPGFRGIQNSFVARPGVMTLMRIIEDIGTYHILVATGQALQESQLRQGFMPSVDVRVNGSMEELIDQYNGQHFAFIYGDWLQDILEYGRLTGIPVVQIQAENTT